VRGFAPAVRPSACGQSEDDELDVDELEDSVFFESEDVEDESDDEDEPESPSDELDEAPDFFLP